MKLPGFKRKLDTYNRIEVSKDALLHNAGFFQKQTKLQTIPVLKANAYGHGIDLVAKALKPGNFPFLAVDGYFEAIKLRKITKNPLLIMGMIKPGDIKKIKTGNTAFVVSDKESIKAFGSLNKEVNLHLEINSGMNRYGIRPEELSEYLELIRQFPKLKLEGVMTHLADPDGEETNIKKAVFVFDKAADKILAEGFEPRFFHLGQSASSPRLKSKHANCARIGLSLYGINPYEPGHKLHKKYRDNLKPALRLISTISHISHLKTGDKVGYNYTFTAKKPITIGVLPLGYYEGLDWRLGNQGEVKYANRFLPIVGKVCMNHTMIDISGSDAQAGSEVMVFSDNPDHPNCFNAASERYGLFVYSLLSGLSSDVRRVLV